MQIRIGSDMEKKRGKTDYMGIKNQLESMCSLNSRICGHSGRQAQCNLFLRRSWKSGLVIVGSNF